MSAAISEQADGDGSVADDCIIFPEIEGIEFVNYVNEEQLDDVMRLVGQDLSEPYSSELLCRWSGYYCFFSKGVVFVGQSHLNSQ